jgi:hypothetical protein
MTTIRTIVVGLTLPAVLLGGCASVPAAERSKAKRDCINTREINVMSPLDDRHVFVKLGADRNYLFTVEDTCQGLRLARQLAIWEATARVCGGGVSLLAFEDPTVGAMRCRIAKIDSVRDKSAALELIAAEVPPK